MTPNPVFPHLSPQAFASLGAPVLCYVREVTGREILAHTPVEAFEGFEIRPDQTLYAVHGADGSRLAVLADRDQAFAAARQNDLAPMSVH